MPICLYAAALTGRNILLWLIYIIVAGLVWWLLSWLVDYCGLPQPFNKVAKVILAVVAVLFLINAIMSAVGSPLMTW